MVKGSMGENTLKTKANQLASTVKSNWTWTPHTLALATEAEAKAATSSHPNFIVDRVGEIDGGRSDEPCKGGGSSDLNVTIY
jgi:hypothetical protein